MKQVFWSWATPSSLVFRCSCLTTPLPIPGEIGQMFAISIFALCVSASVCFTDELHFRCTEDQSIRQGPHYPEPAIFHTVSLEGGVEGGGRWGHWSHFTCTWVSTFSFTHSCVCTFTCACTCIFLCICTLVRVICTTRSPRPPRDKSSP